MKHKTMRTKDKARTAEALDAEVISGAAGRALDRVVRSTNDATRTSGEYPQAVESLGGDAIKLDLGVANFRTVAITYGRKQMIQARKNAEAEWSGAKGRLTDLTTLLSVMGRQLLQDFKVSPAAEQVITAVNAWLGGRDAYTVRLENPEYTRYSYTSNDKKDPAPDLDVANRRFVVTARFYKLNPHNKSVESARIDELDKTFDVPFTPEMIAKCEEIDVAQQAMVNAEQDLKIINRLAAQVDERGDEVETALTLAHLQKQIRDTQDIYNVIRSTMFDTSTLPPRIARLILDGTQQQQQLPDQRQQP